MNELPLRIGLSTFAALLGVLVCSEAVVLVLGPGVGLADLFVPTAALGALALSASGFAFAHARALVGELAELSAGARSPDARPSLLPAARFQESHLLRNELSSLLGQMRRAEAERDAEHAKTDAPLALRVRFVAAMGHDLRTPLNAMLGFADLLAIDKRAAWNPEQAKSLGVLRERARDLLGLIDDMIDWARLEAGELTLTKTDASVLSLVTRATDAAKERSGARGLRVRLDISPDVGGVQVDVARIQQALLGLMDHAARSDGSPELVVHARRAEGEGVQSRRAVAVVRIEIIDPRLELRDGDREQLFQAFRPSFAPSGKRIAGLHLGTAMARALIRAQGGDVWFESRPERGTTFVVTLPAAH